mgnify:CR=1 FL=1
MAYTDVISLANAKDYGGVDAVLPGESTKDGTLVKRRELILIELPDELAEKRRQFFNSKTNRLAVLDVHSFPILRHWYLVHRKGKRLSPVAAAFRSFVFDEGHKLFGIY